MAPRPKTYGTRRSYAKPAGELVNGTTADEPEPRFRRVDVVSESRRSGKVKIPGTVRIEEREDIPSQNLGEEDGPASGTSAGEGALLSHTPNCEDTSTTVSPMSGPPQNRRMSAQDMLPLDASTKERRSSRKSTRRSGNGSATSEDQSLITKTGLESIPIDHTSLSHDKAFFRPNGFTQEQQSCNIDLKDTPSDLNNLAIWVAQLIRKYSDKTPLSAISEPRQEDITSQPGQNIETRDALDNVEGVPMTRGKERKRLQQLKRIEPVNDLNGKFVDRVGESLRLRDEALIERRLKNNLNDKLKQKLFGSTAATDMSTNVIERNACGKLLFNALVDTGNSANHNSAAVLKLALEERKNDHPFFSALTTLASSSEIMALINLMFSKDNAPQWGASNADESRPSTGVETSGETSGATTITETSGLTSRAGTSISDAEGLIKATNRDIATGNKNPEEQKKSREIIQALEAATTVLLQIQQGEAATGYITPYASGSMISNPTGQLHMNSHGTAVYGPPYPNHSTYGMAYGPPVGANLNNYTSPYVNPLAAHPGSYASPYSNPVKQPPASYASPYANPLVPDQASGPGLVGSGHNQANKHGGHEIHQNDTEALTTHQDAIEAVIQAKKGNDETVGRDISDGEKDASREAHDQGVNNEKEGTSKACDEATGRAVSNEKEEASNVVDLDETGLDDANKQDSSSKVDEPDSNDDLTGDDLVTAKTDNQSIAPPAKNHKLFTGERLGDFTSRENIDWLLTVGNGGKIPTPRKKTRYSRNSSFQADVKVQTEVSRIINQIMLCKDWRGYAGATPKQLFYASAEGQRLAVELKRLMAIAEPMVNTIVPSAESQARLRFYQQLESRAIKEKRDCEIQEGMNRYYGAPVQMQQWVPPPVESSVVQFPDPPALPSNVPMEGPVVRRGNVIAAPPGGRNIEEEKKAETYGYPPLPGSRPGDSQPGQKRKRAARH